MAKPNLTPPQVLVAGFAILILLGTVLLSTPWAAQYGSADWMTALFTATSAVCVTGLVVVDTGTYWSSFGQLVIMLLMQIGGLGVMTFATFFALLLGKRIMLRHRLVMQQALNQPSSGEIMRLFKYLLMFSFTVEALGGIILAVHWAPLWGWPRALWYGFFHAVSAFNNAGFDLFGGFSSLTGFTTDLITNLVISGLFITKSQWESWQLDFSRVAALAGKDLNREHIARVTGVHPRLVDEYLELAKSAPPRLSFTAKGVFGFFI